MHLAGLFFALMSSYINERCAMSICLWQGLGQSIITTRFAHEWLTSASFHGVLFPNRPSHWVPLCSLTEAGRNRTALNGGKQTKWASFVPSFSRYLIQLIDMAFLQPIWRLWGLTEQCEDDRNIMVMLGEGQYYWVRIILILSSFFPSFMLQTERRNLRLKKNGFS